MTKSVKTIIAFGIPLLLLLIPLGMYPLEGITLVEKRMVSILVLAALCWILEPIPVFATSVLIIVLELVMISDKGFIMFREGGNQPLGTLLSYKEVMSTFASPIIMLFLGGFFLAMAATKYRLDQNLARVMLKPFGSKPSTVMLGLMAITAVFSMFMSNTATTAMMLSILAPVLMLFPDNDKGKIGFALSIPIAANLGGIGTPIGTPPNAIALKYLTGGNTISFGEWMVFGMPYAIVMVVIGWFILMKLYPATIKEIDLNIKGKFLKTSKAIIVYITFSVTILLWLTDFIHGMNSYVVALIPVAVFTVSGIITKTDLKIISWDVLWLVSGGIALGLGLENTGLAQHFIDAIPFGDFPAMVLIISATMLAVIMANFISNTATANLLLPIVAALASSIDSLQAFGGVKNLVIMTALSCSMGLLLPVSTPPNALAFGTGYFETKDMVKVGAFTMIIGYLLIFLVGYLLI
jgi:solute carrier family 13 (sodium-dependent dicarboxylate transporter), member 2/3/5